MARNTLRQPRGESIGKTGCGKKLQIPNTKHQRNPKHPAQKTDTGSVRCLGFGASLVFGVWCLVLGVWCLVFGAWCLVLRLIHPIEGLPGRATLANDSAHALEDNSFPRESNPQRPAAGFAASGILWSESFGLSAHLRHRHE